MLSLRGPLYAGEACILRRLLRRAGGARETWGPASSFRYAPVVDPTYRGCAATYVVGLRPSIAKSRVRGRVDHAAYGQRKRR